MAGDLPKYGFDTSKGCELIVSGRAGHLQHFTLNPITKSPGKIWNIADSILDSIQFFIFSRGDKKVDILREIIFIDGRHRVKALMKAFHSCELVST